MSILHIYLKGLASEIYIYIYTCIHVILFIDNMIIHVKKAYGN